MLSFPAGRFHVYVSVCIFFFSTLLSCFSDIYSQTCHATNDATNFVDPVEHIIIAGRCHFSLCLYSVLSHVHIRHGGPVEHMCRVCIMNEVELKKPRICSSVVFFFLSLSLFSSLASFSMSYMKCVCCNLYADYKFSYFTSLTLFQCRICFVYICCWHLVQCIFHTPHFHTSTPLYTQRKRYIETPLTQNFIFFLLIIFIYKCTHRSHTFSMTFCLFCLSSFFLASIRFGAIVFRFQSFFLFKF